MAEVIAVSQESAVALDAPEVVASIQEATRSITDRFRESRIARVVTASAIVGGLILVSGGQINGIGLDLAKGGCGGPKTPFPKM